MYILGIWDGHDSGAALVRDSSIIFASNEERYTKRKLEVAFPSHSIKAALDFEGIKPSDVDVVAFPTTELTKTISRVFPAQKEAYYRFRRRKMLRPRAEGLMHYTKYTMTAIGALPLCGSISKACILRELRRLGFEKPTISAIDHHEAHAATAAFTSGMRDCLVVTLDGTGDGVSGSISTLEKGKLIRQRSIPTRDSIGIFFEQVTNIVGMRELEDEGKVMAMADYSFPFKFSENKFREFFSVDGLSMKALYSPSRQYDMLNRVAWGMPREQFAYMAQQLIEHIVAEFVSNALDEFGMHDVAFAGGVMSNIKANMRIRALDKLRRWYIFPHMGDGGIALGAALAANYNKNGVSGYEFSNSYLGDFYDNNYIEQLLKRDKELEFSQEKRKASHAAEIIEENDYVLWFQGRMEFGPRALGNRSILGNSSSERVKDKLNTYVKQREWYQPFAPSMLAEEAPRLLEDVKGTDRFMTMGYVAKRSAGEVMKSVVHVDMTARPQMVGDENPAYKSLLGEVKRRSGYGIVLNTSFNIHGMPIVSSPQDAIGTLKKTGSRYMFIGDYFVENKNAKV
jgi:carbamoyltransferase